MIVQTQTVTGKIEEEQTKTDGEISDDELTDPSYIPEVPTDYEKSQQTTTNQSIESHTEETKYHLVFWSCLLPLFPYCLKCPTYATIKRSVLKGSMLIVTLLCAENLRNSMVLTTKSRRDSCWEYFFCLLQFFSRVILFNVSKKLLTS